MSKPQRIQRRRTKGWRMPDNTVYVGRGPKWGNMYRLGKTLVRVPSSDGTGFEQETDWMKKVGDTYAHTYPGGRTVNHTVQAATVEQCVELFRRGARSPHLRKIVLEKLAGKNLACWCPLDQPCHADVLLELADQEGK